MLHVSGKRFRSLNRAISDTPQLFRTAGKRLEAPKIRCGLGERTQSFSLAIRDLPRSFLIPGQLLIPLNLREAKALFVPGPFAFQARGQGRSVVFSGCSRLAPGRVGSPENGHRPLSPRGLVLCLNHRRFRKKGRIGKYKRGTHAPSLIVVPVGYL
jgi:hypothetical protein